MSTHHTPVPSEATEAGDELLSIYEAATECVTGRCEHEYDQECVTDWLAALLDRVRREAVAEAGEQIAQAIEAEREAVDVEGFGWHQGCRAGLAEAARIARSTP